jgi:hypothetical protein
MTTQTVARAMEKRDTGIDKLMWKNARHLESILPEHVDVKAFLGTAWAALLADDHLMQCAVSKPDTLLIALFRCAAKGHQPGTEEYYLTPRNGGILGIEGYRGIIERMYRSGAVAKVIVREVCTKDYFRFIEGEDDKPVHDFAARRGGTTGADFFGDGGDPDRGAMVGVYGVAKFLTGEWSRPVLLNRNDVFAARAAGGWKPDDKYTPWNRLDAGPDHPEFQGRSMWYKGLALDTPVPTPSGWTAMGNVRPGDLVLDRDGDPVRVTGVSEIKHKDCYRLTFRSGPPITCDDEHLWVARVGRADLYREQVHPIGDLYAAKLAGKPVVIPVARPVDLPAADLAVDPYVLGYWLGDGNRTAGRLTVHASEAAEVEAAVRSAGYVETSTRRDPRGECVTIGIRKLTKALADLGVIGHKHVPAAYLRASAAQRLALLRGLMDSDGSAEASRSRVRFGNTSRHLRDAVAELARSLGEQVLTFENDSTGYGKTVRFYSATWTPSVVPFALSRKVAATRLRKVQRGHSVIAIERVESVPTVCIQVDSPTSTFLAGEAMIPTHNTAAKRLEPWVPTSAEYRREQLRASASAAAASGQGMPVLASPETTEIAEAEIVEPPAITGTADGNGTPQPPADVTADGQLPVEDPPEWHAVQPGTGTPKGK